MLLCLLSCKKEVVENENGVLLRVENKTNDNFSSVITNHVEFGSMKAGSTTGYKRFDKIEENPTAFMVEDGNTVLCGVFYYDYIGYVEKGKYTLQIIPDETQFYGYSCSYIKD
jgi:hypothetical protein